jgi:hypothetical protein
MNREGHVLGSTIMALLISSGARDWKGKGPLLTHSDEIDIHHMVPEQRLTAMGLSRDRRRPIALLTPLDSKTNRELGQLNPADVLKALGGGGGTIMASHHVHEGNLAKAYGSISALDKFIAAREAALKKFIVAELNL